MTTATAPKEKTIMTTKLTASGVKSVLAKTSIGQLERAEQLCSLLANVPHLKEQANKASQEIGALILLAGE